MSNKSVPLLFLVSLCATSATAVALPLPLDAATARSYGPPVIKAKRRGHTEGDASGDLAGRYAVMRDKRDTGCMLTLDQARVKGGARAQLAPGCRDQGIVIFDPAAWTVVKGELVLTARAGHKAHLLKEGEGLWKKGAKDGKPLGLKKL